MLDWNPALYTRYEDERTRPAAELLARVPLTQAARVVDLGCGPGNSTELLARRFPQADVLGIDNSEAMLVSARKRLPQARFEFGDIGQWTPDVAPDLIYANAALQWVPDHETLIPRLFAALAPGGVLAIQMPDNRAEPTHRLMREVASEAPWQEPIGDADKLRTELLGIGGYYDLLARDAAHVDVWHTIYQHPMASAAAIVEWVSSTGLKPFVDPLDAELKASYLAAYERRIAQAYPPRVDGKLLLAFPRLFMVARKA
ncbi:trans-aconitate 2-methyltransferase [Variovorax sp. LT1P1]|uniref:trans-aconitate 2-methyltransferase n=1 Tax=Variovorax sp. LT1P1 TaxID=3443730 RepID=UPI003F44F48E